MKNIDDHNLEVAQSPFPQIQPNAGIIQLQIGFTISQMLAIEAEEGMLLWNMELHCPFYYDGESWRGGLISWVGELKHSQQYLEKALEDLGQPIGKQPKKSW